MISYNAVVLEQDGSLIKYSQVKPQRHREKAVKMGQ